MGELLAVPGFEGDEALQTVGAGMDDDFLLGLIGRRYESVVAFGKTLRRKVVALRAAQLHGFAFCIGEAVGDRIEVQPTGDSQRRGQLRTGYEGIGVGIAVGAPTEVAVERGYNGIAAGVVVGVALPLPNTRAAGIGHHHGSDAPEVIEQTIAFGRSLYALGSRTDIELSLHIDVLGIGIAGH